MSIYRWAMRHGSPILFWLALAVVVLSIFQLYDTLEQAQSSMGIGFEGLRFFTRFKLLLSAVAQSLLTGSLPFAAAVLVHRVDKYQSTKAEVAK